MSFTLPDLPYSHDALAPYMSRETLEYHHDKHHKAYVDTGNKLLEGSGLEGKSLEEVVKGAYGKNQGLFNNAGQHFNHTHFWKWMKPNGGGDKIPGKLKAKIDSDLGGLAKMKEDFVNAGVTQFGSGWCWIAVQNGKLAITKTPNGENPLVHGGTPILGCDVWEHSYYIDYRNRRADYLGAEWQARHHQDTEWRKSAGARRHADPRLRRVGALLLHRLPQSPRRLSQSLPRPSGELGLRGGAARRREIALSPALSKALSRARLTSRRSRCAQRSG